MIKLGLLDFGLIGEKSNSLITIKNSIESAVYAEKLGYRKYWLSEHHEPGVAWRDPTLLLSLFAGYTKKIKIGSAGVLLPLANPLRIAQSYKLLANMYPGRIDLGLAKGIANNKEVLDLLMEGQKVSDNIECHFKRAKQVIEYMHSNDDRALCTPSVGEIPTIWMLGTSLSSIDFVIKEKCAFSLSFFHFKPSHYPVNEIKEFKEKYKQTNGTYPQFNIAVSYLCTQKKSEALTAAEFYKSFHLNITGSPDDFLDEINKLNELFYPDEIIILDASRTLKDRMICLESMMEKIVQNNKNEKFEAFRGSYQNS